MWHESGDAAPRYEKVCSFLYSCVILRIINNWKQRGDKKRDRMMVTLWYVRAGRGVGDVLEHRMFSFSLQHKSEMFLILRRDQIKNVYMFVCKTSIINVKFQ